MYKAFFVLFLIIFLFNYCWSYRRKYSAVLPLKEIKTHDALLLKPSRTVWNPTVALFFLCTVFIHTALYSETAYTLMHNWKKTASIGSAESEFVQILCQICPVFRQILPIFTNCYPILPNLPKFTKLYKFYQNLPNFTKLLKKNYKICDLCSFDAISNCCNLRVFSAKSVSPNSQGWIYFFYSALMVTL